MSEIDTLKWLLSLVGNNPWRDIYFRGEDKAVDYLRNKGWIELIDWRVIKEWPGYECTYRFTIAGRLKAYDAGIITLERLRKQSLD